jgi:hypothetical protein
MCKLDFFILKPVLRDRMCLAPSLMGLWSSEIMTSPDGQGQSHVTGCQSKEDGFQCVTS